MRLNPRVILDTNLLISRLLTPSSVTAGRVRLVMEYCRLLASQETMNELIQTLARMQRKQQIIEKDSSVFLGAYKDIVEWIPIIERVALCRDPKDDKFLDLAANGKPDYLITGDRDLLVLDPFRTTRIMPIQDFIRQSMQ